MYDVKEFHFNNNECWFRHKCPNFNTEKCNCACGQYCKFFYLANLANIPKPMQYPENQILEPGQDKNEYKYLEKIKSNIYEWVQEGNNLLLYSSTCGNGKTTWAIKLMCKYFSEVMYEPDYDFQCRGLFINVDEFMYDYKKQINKKDERFQEILNIIDNVDLVIWDDIGNTPLTDFGHSVLYPIINKRIISGKANIFTTNVIDDELAHNIGTRLASRILETSDVLEFINASKRQPKSRRK